MADEESNQAESEDVTPPSVPSHSPLPPPPEVHYTRPNIGQSASGRSGNSSHVGSDSSGQGDRNSPVNHGAGLAAGSTFVVGIIAGATIGNWIDQRYNHTGMPWATLIMTLLGAAAGFSNMLRLLSRSDRNRKNK